MIGVIIIFIFFCHKYLKSYILLLQFVLFSKRFISLWLLIVDRYVEKYKEFSNHDLKISITYLPKKLHLVKSIHGFYFAPFIIRLCLGKLIEFATKTFSKRRLFPIHDCWCILRKCFSIARNYKKNWFWNLPIKIQLKQTVNQNCIHGNEDEDIQSI